MIKCLLYNSITLQVYSAVYESDDSCRMLEIYCLLIKPVKLLEAVLMKKSHQYKLVKKISVLGYFSG